MEDVQVSRHICGIVAYPHPSRRLLIAPSRRWNISIAIKTQAMECAYPRPQKKELVSSTLPSTVTKQSIWRAHQRAGWGPLRKCSGCRSFRGRCGRPTVKCAEVEPADSAHQGAGISTLLQFHHHRPCIVRANALIAYLPGVLLSLQSRLVWLHARV